MPVNHIFVYGSLRREFSSPVRSVLEEHAEFIALATFRGKLYKVDRYPGAVESDHPDDVVHGEVYKIKNRNIVLSRLDQYECCTPDDPEPHEFTRKKRPVKLQNGETVTAWVYLYNHSVSGKAEIYSGDFVSM